MSGVVAPSNVSVREIEVAFGPVKVLDRLSLEVAQSEFVVLLGPSGCGKSTLLNAVAGLHEVDAGQIWIGDRNVTWEEPKNRGVAMVFQSYALYPRMRVRDNLSFGLRVAGRPRAEIETRVMAAAEMLRIAELLDRRPAELSGGQRQRVAIGRALVFLFDEPLSNLDAQLRAELRVEIKRLHRRLGTTMVYVTHDQIEALTLADRIAVMRGGEILQFDAPHKVYLEPTNRFVASFVGSPAMNFVDGRLAAGATAPAFEGDELRVALDGYRFAAAPAIGAAVTLGIRPEHIALGAGGGVAATVELVEPMGADSLVWCRCGATSLSVRLDGERCAPPGTDIRLAFSPDRLSLFDAASGERL
jgi:multiple sugar transport system ATP-binding protein